MQIDYTQLYYRNDYKFARNLTFMDYILEYDPLKKQIMQYRIAVGNGEEYLEQISGKTLKNDGLTNYIVSHIAKEFYNTLEKLTKRLENNKTPQRIKMRFQVVESFVNCKEDWIPEITAKDLKKTSRTKL